MTSPDVNIIFAEEPININLGEDPVEIEMPAGQNGQSLRPRGAWSSSESYGYLDLVSYQGSSYVATKTVPVGTLPTDTGFWMLSAEKGLDGASEWGDITGNIANQTDLAQALAGKANVGDVYTKDETDALLTDKAPVITETASGPAVSISDGFPSSVTALSVGIEAVQTGSGDPSASNIRAIYGHKQTGIVLPISKNLLGGIALRDRFLKSIDGCNDYPDDKYLTYAAASLITDRYITRGVPFKEKTSYTFILTLYKNSSGSANLRLYYTNGTYENFSVTEGGTKQTVIAVSNPTKTVDRLQKFNSSGSVRLYYDESGIFEGELTAQDFVPFIGTYLPISWETEAGTVYGGNLDDVLTGLLTVTDGYIASYNGETLPSTWISDRDVYAPGTTPTTGAQVVYKLASPQTYQITPEQLSILQGETQIWTDTGNTSVTYRADTKLFIEKQIAESETMTRKMIADIAVGDLAPKSLATGDLIIVGDELRKATANIGNGSAITASNSTTATLADVIKALQ